VVKKMLSLGGPAFKKKKKKEDLLAQLSVGFKV
jgi:hypothetical protein